MSELERDLETDLMSAGRDAMAETKQDIQGTSSRPLASEYSVFGSRRFLV